MKRQVLTIAVLFLIAIAPQPYAQTHLPDYTRGLDNLRRTEDEPRRYAFEGQPSVYNIKKVGGALCNGVADDTNAVMKTVAAVMATQRGGIVYFPESSGPCNVKTLNLPDSPGGWLYFLFDNSMLVCTVHPGHYNAFVGRTGGFYGLSGAFGYGPTVNWLQGPGCGGPVIELDSVQPAWFENIDVETRYDDTAPVLHINNQAGGTVWITLINCILNQNGATDYREAPGVVADTVDPNQAGGFGLRVEKSTIGGYPYSMSLTNYGMVEIRDSTISEGGIRLTNLGPNPGGDLTLDNVLTENLKDTDVVDVESTGPINDIMMRDVRITDRLGTVYMLKHVAPQYTNVIFEDTPIYQEGNGFIDPASSPQSLVVTCIGAHCGFPTTTKAALYKWSGIGLDGPDVFYMPGQTPVQFLSQ